MENLQGGSFSLKHLYQVEARQGRFALVTRYHGEQRPFERPVWIEVYDPLDEVGANPRVYERIKESAHRAHRLDAPGILRTLDYGKIDRGVPFVVSERLAGPTLADYLESNGPLTPGAVIEMVDRLAGALAAAHEEGIPHGTLSTEWIYLEGSDPTRPAIGHFQVGLTLDELRRMDGAVLTPDVVRAYPPETFQSDTIPPEDVGEEHDPTDEFTPTADIYALGAVVYESLVGFHPFFDDEEEPTDASEGIARIQSEAPRPLKDFGVEDELSEVVERALARQPGQRWESVGAFADALNRAHGNQSTSQPTSPEADTAPSPETSPEVTGDRASDPAIEPPASNEFDTSAESIEPGGPSSILTTLAIAVLIASNIAWFVYALGSDDASGTEAPPVPAVTNDTLQIDSQPSGATVYVEGREKPLGKTPVDLPITLFDSAPIHLDVRKTGFEETGVSVRARDGSRQLIVPLHNKTAN